MDRAKDLVVPIELTKEVEETFPVHRIKVEGLPAWPFLRNTFFIYSAMRWLGNSTRPEIVESTAAKLYKKWNIVANSLWGGRDFFAQKPFWLVSNALEDRYMEGRGIINKIAWPAMQEIGDDLLYFHDPLGQRHTKKSSFAHPLVTSVAPFYLYRALLRRQQGAIKIEGEEILREIFRQTGISFDYEGHCREFLAIYKTATKRLAMNKPGIIFFTCYDRLFNEALLYAAHDAGVRVIALQHGFITDTHPSYQCFYEQDKACLPDEHWVFGQAFGRMIHPNIATRDQIRVVGNRYLRERLKNSTQDREMAEKFSDLKLRFRMIVLVTLQGPIEDRVLPVIRRWSRSNPDLGFLCLPRVFREDFHGQFRSDNMLIEAKADFYRLLPFADFHCTAFSSCAIEALVAGIPSILIDINGYASHYLGRLLDNSFHSRFVQEDEVGTDLFLREQYGTADEIRQASLPFYADNESALIRQALAAQRI